MVRRSFRAEYARKSHNTIEKKRKDKIAIWINKISELLPKDPKKESKNAILEKAFHYMVHLKEMNDKLIYGNADQIIGKYEIMRFTVKIGFEMSFRPLQICNKFCPGINIISGKDIEKKIIHFALRH